MPWYAVYTKPRCEKKVVKLLNNINIENYCPMQTQIRQWADRKKEVEVPLLPSYVFVKIPSEDQTNVRMVDGVVNFVYWLGKTALIKEKEIEQLKNFVGKYTNIVIYELKNEIGGEIVISSGPFEGKKATIKAIKKNAIELFLESLGIRLVVEKTSSKAI